MAELASKVKNFVNFHVLISHSPSCLNRDDQNMQKRAVFGGVERIRVSSQCLKRAMRRPDENATNYWAECGALGAPSIRTRSIEGIASKLCTVLRGEYEDCIVRSAVELFSKAGKPADDSEDGGGDDTGTGDEKGIAVAPWVIAEIREVCRAIKTVTDAGLTEDEKVKASEKAGKEVGKKGNKRKLTAEECVSEALTNKIVKQIADSAEVIAKAAGEAADLALWGRMSTSGLMTSVDGSLAVAHAITTHAAQADTDWFTAVDDLVQDSGEVGAGHLDTQEFSAGVFYRYASLNIAQLQKNLGGATRDRALEIAKHVFHMMCTVVPSAKQQSYAAHNNADFAFVTLDHQPISYANAFERPVEKDKHGGYLAPSVKALVEYHNRMFEMYGIGESSAGMPQIGEIGGLADGSAKVGGIKLKKSLAEVEEWIVSVVNKVSQ